MDPKIKQLKSTTFNGRRFTRRQLSDMQRIVENFPKLSRNELAQTICENLKWRTPSGGNSFQACLGVLRQLEQLGVLQLPPKVQSQRRGGHQPLARTERGEPQPRLEAKLKDLLPLRLEVVTEKEDHQLWKEWVDRYHYLGHRHPIGPHLRYFVVDAQGRRLGCMGFCYAVKQLPCRDEWIGWQQQKHKKHLHLVVNQNRFLILPWVKVKNLASKALSMACRQLSDDWQRMHRYRPVLIETFVDKSKFEASCYRAANWTDLGTTEKRSDKTQKAVYVYPLEADAKTILKQGRGAVRKRAQPAPASSPQLEADDPFVQLWQQIIGILTEVAADFDAQWQIRRRVLNTLLVMLFIFRLVFSQQRQGYTTVIAELWQQCRRLGVALPQQQPVTAAAMCRARRKLDEQVFKQLHGRVLQQAATSWQRFQWCGHRLYAVDGSHMNLPRDLVKRGYQVPHKGHYPQGLVSVLYQLQSKIPIDFELAAHHDERKMARRHLPCLQPDDVVVYDRGYYSYEMLHEHVSCGVHAIFRMKKNATAVVERFCESAHTEQLVEIVAGDDTRRRLRRRTGQTQFPNYPLRLVKYTHGGTSYTLATTLLDRSRYAIQTLSDAYHSRWGIEELYKISKQMMTVEQFHGKTERGVKQELYAHFVLITLTRLFTNHSEAELQSAESEPHQRKLRVNYKNSLAVLGRHFEELLLRQTQLLADTVSDMLDSVRSGRYRERLNRSFERKSKQPVGKWNRGRPKKAADAAGGDG